MQASTSCAHAHATHTHTQARAHTPVVLGLPHHIGAVCRHSRPQPSPLSRQQSHGRHKCCRTTATAQRGRVAAGSQRCARPWASASLCKPQHRHNNTTRSSSCVRRAVLISPASCRGPVHIGPDSTSGVGRSAPPSAALLPLLPHLHHAWLRPRHPTLLLSPCTKQCPTKP
jgi:hypothetical protein